MPSTSRLTRRILVIPGKGRTAQELGQFCLKAFRQLAADARILLFNPQGAKLTHHLFRWITNERIVWELTHFRPDLVLTIKSEGLALPFLRRIKKKFNITLANWWIDDPAQLHRSTKLSPAYDYFFTCDPESVSVHKRVNCPHVFALTFGCDPSLHRKVSLSDQEKVYYGSDIAFVGSISSQRADLLREIADKDIKIWSYPEFANFDGERIIHKPVPSTDILYKRFTGKEAWGEELVKVYNASKIILNLHAQGVVSTNMRTFEVMGCGAFLLTEERRTLNQLFKEGEEFISFEKPEDLPEMVRYYLKEEEKRSAIARRGQQAVYQKHTYRDRMQEFFKLCEEGRVSGIR